MDTLKREYTPDASEPQPIRFFCSGEPYRFWDLFDGDFHLICPPEGGTLFLLGTDRLGRDMLSRLLYGARISLTIGLVGVTLSYTIGIIIGGIAGYFGGLFDSVVQRVTEVLRSIPELPLWMALSAALPVTWDPRAHLFRHHHHPGAARLALDRARRALQALRAARGGLRRGGGDDGRQAVAHHRRGISCRTSPAT